MSKFTVGKWNESEGIITVVDATGKWIWNVADILCCAAEEETEANARLIASAPEMYELLKVFAYPAEYDSTVTTELRTKAQELVARIDGEEVEE